MKKFFAAFFASVILSAGGIGAPGNATGNHYSDEGFRFTFISPAPQLEKSGEYTAVKIESFGLTGEEGNPLVPVKIFKAAIPENATVSLRVVGSRVEELKDVRIPPVPRYEVKRRPEDIGEKTDFHGSDPDLSENDLIYKVHEKRPEVFGSPSPYPTSPVKLGKTGHMRDQKYIEIIFTPVLTYPAERRALFFSEVEVSVEFNYLSGTVADTSLTHEREQAFERIYKKSFINYEQGRSFRLSGTATLDRQIAASQDAQYAPSFASSTYKLKVSSNGIYRLTYSYLSANAGTLLTEDPRTYKLMNRGVEVPIHVSGESDGVFDTGDYIEFYGQALTDEPKTILNYDMPDPAPDIYQDNDFTDTNVYFLSAEAPSGERQRVQNLNGYPSSGYPVPDDFYETAHLEHIEADGTNVDVFLPLGGNDPWFWGPRVRSNSSPNYEDADIPLPGLSALPHTAELRVKLRGTTSNVIDPDHTTVTGVISGGTYITDTRDEQSWDAETIFTHTKSFSQSHLSSLTRIRVEAKTVPGVSLSELIRDYIEIGYYRLFDAVNDTLTFGSIDGNYRFDVDNFTNSSVAIYEITDRVTGSDVVSATRIVNPLATGSGPYTVSFEVSDDPDLPPGTARSFIVSRVSTLLIPDSCVLETSADLRNTANQADIIVIGTPDTIDDSSGSPLDLLLGSRLTNRGLTSKVVMFEDICDEFNDGLFDPNAIRLFLAYAYSSWTDPKPSYVFIIGDGTYDYKNMYSLVGFKSYVPTQIMFQVNATLGYYSSDNWLACFLGTDQLPDIHLGRISTSSVSESNFVLNKIRAYEDSPLSGSWQSHDLLISDEGKNADPSETEEFERINDDLISTYNLDQSPYSRTKIFYAKAPYNGTDHNLCRQHIKDAINSGTVITNFVGHGNFTTWSNDDIFYVDDIATLTNLDKYPFLIVSNCLTAGFQHAIVTSIGEKFVNSENKGSIATFAPSGLSLSFVGETMLNAIFEEIYGPHKERESAILTYSARDAMYSLGQILDAQAYTYLGDPVLDLVIPKPAPPTSPDAVGGDQQVDLTWTRSADDPSSVVGYNVYRTTNPDTAYTKINTTLITDDFYTDTNLTNLTTYYYAITAQDSSDFESAYSNFNTDCDIDGSDCVKATPENPNPPANPTGFDAADPETGEKLNLSWNANAEADLKEYILYWGTVSRFDPEFPGSYENSKSVGKATSHVLSGLEDGVTYYLCVTAKNTSLKESGYSNEDSDTPSLVLGIKPPKAISDLMVKRSTINGNDLELTWTKPALDIYGNPETIQEYKIFRNTLPNFIPSEANRITTITNPDTTNYQDSGAYSSSNNYYYLIQSIDTDGNVSGVGRELPQGIKDLTVRKSTTPGNIIFSWGAITKDVSGKTTIISHYKLYGRDTKFSRSDIENGIIPLIQDNITSTTLEITPAAGNRYYSVIAVDNRGNRSPF